MPSVDAVVVVAAAAVASMTNATPESSWGLLLLDVCTDRLVVIPMPDRPYVESKYPIIVQIKLLHRPPFLHHSSSTNVTNEAFVEIHDVRQYHHLRYDDDDDCCCCVDWMDRNRIDNVPRHTQGTVVVGFGVDLTSFWVISTRRRLISSSKDVSYHSVVLMEYCWTHS